ncbi:MAG: amino acid adenylation domain-containing protein, partial [Candidatus Omnitrophota bacterium]
VLMWENFFGVGKIGIIDDFFELGGDSLKAMTLSGKIHRQFDVEIQLTDFFGHPTIKDLATLIDSSTKNEFRSIPKAPKKDHYLLSAAQKRLFFIQHMAPEGTAYNLPQVLMLPDAPDNDQLERIFNTLIERHESFRTSFELTEEGPVQRIHDPEQVPFSIHYPDYPINPKDLNTELLKFVVPFDLSAAPLLRAAVIKTTENTWMLFTDMHHIISDGVSMTRLETEFTDLVAGRTLPPLPIQYRDFSEWQNSEEQQQKTTDKAQYWLNQFGDSVPTLELPYDFPRPPVTSFEGNTTRFGLEKEIVDRLKEIGAPSDATLYMVLMAIYFVFLSKLSGQDDIVVGIPVAGRNHPDLQPIIGMFVNTLAIRNYPVAEQTFLNFLEEVKASALGAYENQDYPFEELVEKLNLDRNTARNPVFDVVFNMLNQAEFKGELPSFNQEYVHTPGISKYDLNMYFVEIEGGRGLIFNVEYGSKLFKPETINRFIGYFKYIVSQVLMQPDIELKAIDILGEDERHQIVSEFSQSGETFAIDNTLHGLFDEQVVRTPDNIALIGNFYQGAFLKNRPLDPQKTFCFLTYHRLNEQSEHLACVLRDKGVNSNVIVGIQIERSIEMIIGILGILKAGGAYLPIDTDYPQERIDYMLKDSGVQVFITEREFEAFRRGAPACAPGSNSEIITIGQTRGSAPTENLPEEASYLLNAFPLPATGHRLPVTSLAYVIYTSGSTGRPKGVMVEHRSISNTIYWRMNEYKMKPNDRALQLFSFAFDGFITSFFTPVVSGAAVIQLSAEDVKDTGRIKEVIARMGITHLIAVPSLYRMILETGTEKELSGLKIITLAGEQVQTDIIEKSRTMNPSLEIVNEYGPTEGSVVVSYYRNLNRGGGISIGKPIANMSIIIIDRQMNLVPVGIAGEIALKGKGLARGYLNNPELTAERFLSVDSVSSVANKFYKTGDMGKWSEDGNIQFLGRMDQQVKIRGFRIELGEIENRLLTYKDIKEAVVLCGEEHGDKYLCAYIVSDSEYDVAELRNYLSGQLPQVMVPSYFVKMDRIPLTSNGKINRSALPKPVLTGGASYVAPGDDVEKTLIEIWGTVLNTQTPIGIDDNFFHLGGHSLKAAILAGRIRRQFQIDFSLLELFKTPTVREIASLIKFILWAKEKPADITETENHIQQEEDNEEIFI